MGECMRGLYSHSREYRKLFSRDQFPRISQILEGNPCGANTCRTCIRTGANTGKKPWRKSMYGFRAREYARAGGCGCGCGCVPRLRGIAR